jgi:hypothetical protein
MNAQSSSSHPVTSMKMLFGIEEGIGWPDQ